MALKDYLVPVGFFKKTDKFVPGHFSMKKLVASILKQLNVAYQDECCEGLSNSAPVRFNTLTSELEYYDVEMGWVSTESASTTTTTSSSTTTTTTVA